MINNEPTNQDEQELKETAQKAMIKSMKDGTPFLFASFDEVDGNDEVYSAAIHGFHMPPQAVARIVTELMNIEGVAEHALKIKLSKMAGMED